MLRTLLCSTSVALLTVVVHPAVAVEMAYRCSDVQGTNITAPNWEPVPDGFAGRSVLIHFTGTGVGYITGFDGERYPGFETNMNGGFAIIVVGEEFLETYVINAANQELLMTATRTGSSFFPNSAKAFRGSCSPAGSEVSQ